MGVELKMRLTLLEAAREYCVCTLPPRNEGVRVKGIVCVSTKGISVVES
jgi:hypothetical protein